MRQAGLGWDRPVSINRFVLMRSIRGGVALLSLKDSASPREGYSWASTPASPQHTRNPTLPTQTGERMHDDSLGRSNAAAAAVIVVAACPKERTLRVLDLATGTTYFTFGDTAATALAPVAGARAAEGLGSAGDYLVSSQVNEQALVFHRWGKTQPLFKCRTPEPMGPVLTTPDGLYVLAGGRSGKAYAWEVASGLLVQSWDAHFKSVTCMAVTSDGGFLITGSEDTMVRAWALADVLAAGNATGEGAGAGGVQPFRSWSEHSLPVTGLYCGQGGPSCRIVSCSLDHTVQVYELASEAGAVCSLRTPSGLACVTMDAGEKRLLVGGASGDIFVVDMDVVSQARTASRALVHAVGGVGGQQGGGGSERWDMLAGHSKAVTSLVCSWDGRVVVSASEDGSLRWWDVDSQQCVKKVILDTPGPITGLLILPRPTALLEMLPKNVFPAPMQPLKKYSTATGGGDGDDTVFVPGRKRGRKEGGVNEPAASLLLFSLWGGCAIDDKVVVKGADVSAMEEEVVEEGKTKTKGAAADAKKKTARISKHTADNASCNKSQRKGGAQGAKAGSSAAKAKKGKAQK